jgi:hypothetical protein
MNCDKAREMILLYAGGDLPDSDIQDLESHLAECTNCRSELAAVKESIATIGKLDVTDAPPPLPDDFADRVVSRVPSNITSKRLWPRVVTISVAAAAVLILAIAWWIKMETDQFEENMQAVLQTQLLTVSILSEFLDDSVIEPTPVEEWQPTEEAGVFLVMHQPDPENQPEQFAIDYCGERSRLGSYQGYTWLPQIKRRLLARAGTEDNVFVAVYPMPGSSKSERKQIKQQIIEKYDPHFNRDRGV